MISDESLTSFDDEGGHQMLGPDDELTLPQFLGAFRVIVGRFFD